MNKKITTIITIISVFIVTTVYFLSTSYNTSVSQTTSNITKSFNQTAMLERGNVAMGLNQTKIHHHFMSTTTGGEIMIMSANMSDTQTINEIKDHVKDIQYEFSHGNFTKPFYIHSEFVTDTDVMTSKKNLIQYSIKDIDGGSLLILTTNDDELLNAIQQFMNFQSNQHMGH